jgi:2'-5' RNA ligase
VQGIVTVLDEPWRERVEEIWGELAALFGLPSVGEQRDPHVTYHVADAYDRDAIDAAMSKITSAAPTFDLETHGLGVFRGEQTRRQQTTVLYLHVTPSPALRALHETVLRAVDGIAREPRAFYAPETWVPHITLAAGGLREEQLPDIMALLGRRDYRWRMRATNLCFVPDAMSRAEPWVRWELRGQ